MSHSASSSVVPPRRTFYRRPLPDTCVALSSPQGRIQFESSLRTSGLKSFFPLIEQFTTQSEPSFCGISSLVMVLNALAVDPRRLWKGPWRWYHEELLNCCLDLEQIKLTGITLNIFACLARCQGLQVRKYLAEEVSLDDFRQAVHTACVEDDKVSEDHDDDAPFLVVSYNRKVLKQTGSGHFSPIAAFDKASDQLLILDTARFKYGSHWVPLELLFEAMRPLDPDTGKSRGYVLLSYQQKEATPSMPMSIILRSIKAKSSVRQNYQRLLESRGTAEITFDQVMDYWTKEGKDMDYIWDMMEPQLAPVEEEASVCVDTIRQLGQALMPMEPSSFKQKCGPNSNRVICLAPEEAIFIVYLASLEPQRRKEIIFTDAVEADTVTRQQLLCEADLVRFAIDESVELGEELEQQRTRCCETSK